VTSNSQIELTEMKEWFAKKARESRRLKEEAQNKGDYKAFKKHEEDEKNYSQGAES
jgi:hypothetical protein